MDGKASTIVEGQYLRDQPIQGSTFRLSSNVWLLCVFRRAPGRSAQDVGSRRRTMSNMFSSHRCRIRSIIDMRQEDIGERACVKM